MVTSWSAGDDCLARRSTLVEFSEAFFSREEQAKLPPEVRWCIRARAGLSDVSGDVLVRHCVERVSLPAIYRSFFHEVCSLPEESSSIPVRALCNVYGDLIELKGGRGEFG